MEKKTTNKQKNGMEVETQPSATIGSRLAQKELGNAPSRDEVGKAAKEYKDSIDAVDQAKHNRLMKMEDLAGVMKKHKRLEVSVEGVTFFLKHKDAIDEIKVKRPKRKNQ